jgi:translocation and assembly module TamB
MKRTALSVLLALLFIIVSGSWYVLNSQWGLELTYNLVRHVIPGELIIQSRQGKLLGPLNFTDISYTNDDISLTLNKLMLDWQPFSLFKGTLLLTTVDAHDLRLEFDESSGQSASMGPVTFTLPFAIEVLDARLSQAAIHTGKQQLIEIKQLILQAEARDNAIQLTQLMIESELFDLTTNGKLGLNKTQAVTLHTVWTARLPEFSPLQGSGSFTGSLRQLEVEQTIKQAGVDLSLQGKLNDIMSNLKWDLSMDVKQLFAQQLSPTWPALSIQGKLDSSGSLDAFDLAGDMRTNLPDQGSLQANFEINATPDMWKLTRFNAQHSPTKATLNANGVWHPGPELGTVTLTGGWHRLTFPLMPTGKTRQFVSNAGNFTISGKLDNYKLNTIADITAYQLPTMHVALDGHGDRKQINFSNITAQTLDGNITGSGLAVWEPDIAWEGSLRFKNINPAVQWPSWPGRLDAEISASGRTINKTSLFNRIKLKSLTGQLRDYPVDSHGMVSWGNKKINIKDVKLDIGDSKLRVSGSRDEKWAMRAELNAPDLNALCPYSRGQLIIKVDVAGPRATPHIIANIAGDRIAFEDYLIGKIAGNFDIDLQSDEAFDTMLTATELTKGGKQWESLTFNAAGTRTQHQLKLELKQETDRIQLVVNAGLNEQQIWQGEIANTIVNAKKLGAWKQIRSAPFTLGINQASLEPWCLVQPGARICLQGERLQKRWNANLDANQMPLALLENWLPAHLQLHGKADIDSNLHYVPKRELTGDLLVNIPEGFRLEVTDKEQSFKFDTGRMQATLNKTGLDANIDLPAADLGGLKIQLDLPDWNALAGLLPTQPLTAQLKLSLVSLAHLNGFFLDYPELTGALAADLHLGGTIGTPLLTGETRINQASAVIPALGIKLEDINFRAFSKAGSQLDYQLSARSGKAEPLTITGYTLLQMPDGWPTKLHIRGNEFQLANLPDAKIEISPKLDVDVQGRRIDLNGIITVPNAIFRPRTLPQTTVSPSRDVVFIDEAELPLVEEHWKVFSHVRVILGDHVYFDGFGLRGEVRGNILLIDEPGKLTVGQGEISITEGTYKAYGQDAKIRRGRLMFANTVIDDPGIDLEAVREIDTVTAGVRVHGTLKQPELTLFSEPAMSESDIISYFLLGRPMEATTEDEKGQQLQKAMLAARLAGGELIVDQTGIYSYLDEISFETDKTTEQTALVVGKYLSPKLYVRYVTGLIESSSIVEIHYKLSKYLRVQTEAGYRRSTSVTGADIYYTIEY